jgi:hypothetical protein
MTPNEHQIRVKVLTRACAATGSILETVTPGHLALARPRSRVTLCLTAW